MRICPQCGGPFPDDEVIIASKEMTCPRCRWTGTSEGTILIDENVTGMEDFQSQLEKLYVGLAQQVAPVIGKLLIESGMVLAPTGLDEKEDKRRIEFLARVLQGSTRGTVQGIASVIAEEMNRGRN